MLGDLAGLPQSQLAVLPGTAHFVAPGFGAPGPSRLAAGDDRPVPRRAHAGGLVTVTAGHASTISTGSHASDNRCRVARGGALSAAVISGEGARSKHAAQNILESIREARPACEPGPAPGAQRSSPVHPRCRRQELPAYLAVGRRARRSGDPDRARRLATPDVEDAARLARRPSARSLLAIQRRDQPPGSNSPRACFVPE